MPKPQTGDRGRQTTGRGPALGWCPSASSWGDGCALQEGTREEKAWGQGLPSTASNYLSNPTPTPTPGSRLWAVARCPPGANPLCYHQARTACRARLAGVALAAREAEGRMLLFGIGATAFTRRTVNLETRVAAASHFLHSGPGARDCRPPCCGRFPRPDCIEQLGDGVVGYIWN